MGDIVGGIAGNAIGGPLGGMVGSQLGGSLFGGGDSGGGGGGFSFEPFRLQSEAALKAAGISKDYSEQALKRIEDQYKQQQAQLSPYQVAGQNAQAYLNLSMGMPADPTDPNQWGSPNDGNRGLLNFLNSAQGRLTLGSALAPTADMLSPEFAGAWQGSVDVPGMFKESEAYKFNLDQAQKAINAAASARGYLNNPNVVREQQKYAAGLASQEFNNWQNRVQNSFNNYQAQLAGMTGQGLAATNSNQQLGLQNIGMQSSNLVNTGNTLANAQMASANALSQGQQQQLQYNNQMMGQVGGGGLNQMGNSLAQGVQGLFGGGGVGTYMAGESIPTPFTNGGFLGSFF